MTALPPWVAGLPDAEIARHFGATTVERGRTYQRDGRVGRLPGGLFQRLALS